MQCDAGNTLTGMREMPGQAGSISTGRAVGASVRRIKTT